MLPFHKLKKTVCRGNRQTVTGNQSLEVAFKGASRYFSLRKGRKNTGIVKKLCLQAFKQRVEAGNLNHNKRESSSRFTVFAQATGVVEPRESTLNNIAKAGFSISEAHFFRGFPRPSAMLRSLHEQTRPAPYAIKGTEIDPIAIQKIVVNHAEL